MMVVDKHGGLLQMVVMVSQHHTTGSPYWPELL